MADDNGEPTDDLVPAILDTAHQYNIQVGSLILENALSSPPSPFPYSSSGISHSLYLPGCPGTCSVDQAGLQLRDSPASAFQVLELKTCATTAMLRMPLLCHKVGVGG
jgi:hypothetical protein